MNFEQPTMPAQKAPEEKDILPQADLQYKLDFKRRMGELQPEQIKNAIANERAEITERLDMLRANGYTEDHNDIKKYKTQQKALSEIEFE